MISTYYTFRALAERWHADLVGAVVGDAYSQERGELTLAFAHADGAEWSLRFSVRGAEAFAFRAEGHHRARRNTATLFEDAFDRRVTAVRVAHRDRVLFVDLDGGLHFRAPLFGPRANVFLAHEDGTVVEAFQSDGEWAGGAAPEPRPAPVVDTPEAFDARWRTNRRTVAQAVASAFPLFDRLLATETAHRAGIDADASPAEVDDAGRRALFEAGRALDAELTAPAPCIYWRGRFADAFSLVPLRHRDDAPEAFGDVDDAVRVFVRRTFAEARFRRLYEPLERALESAAAHHRRSAERMLEELSNESRADRYERWGHLLMAHAAGQGPGPDAATVPDIFEGGEAVEIPLDPARSAVDNAQRYYDRARRTRQSRAHAEDRLVATEAKGREAERLLDALRAQDTVAELERFRKDEADALARFAGDRVEEADRLPFRRYDLGGGYEVWVGRNAKGNDLLTFRHAQKYDLWMHARGVPGSHAVLRKPNRDADPGRPILERAAAIAAYHSKARGSALVPVMVTERKYVRKPKGAAPGAVLVEREEVLIVEPRLP